MMRDGEIGVSIASEARSARCLVCRPCCVFAIGLLG